MYNVFQRICVYFGVANAVWLRCRSEGCCRKMWGNQHLGQLLQEQMCVQLCLFTSVIVNDDLKIAWCLCDNVPPTYWTVYNIIEKVKLIHVLNIQSLCIFYNYDVSGSQWVVEFVMTIFTYIIWQENDVRTRLKFHRVNTIDFLSQLEGGM